MNGDPKPPNEAAERASTELVIAPVNNGLTVVDYQVAELQEKLAEAKDNAQQDKFYFLLVGVIVFDVFAFQHVGGGLSVLILTLLECVLLAGVARRLGVEEPAILFATLYRKILNKIDKSD